MRHGEFITHINELCNKDGLVLRALGKTASVEQFRLVNSTVGTITQPTVAVLSSAEMLQRDRNYTILATATNEETETKSPYPVLSLPAEHRPALTEVDFMGEFDRQLSASLVSLSASGDPLEEPIGVWYLEDNVGSLVVNGRPTYSPAVTEALSKLY